MEIRYKAIGRIISPFKTAEGTPIQGPAARDIEGKVEVFPEYQEGLTDIEGFSHLILLYHFHLVKKGGLTGRPFMDKREHGIFAFRGPGRPNPIGISIVRLLKVEGNILFIKDVDILDNTPLLDIKPYIPEFDYRDVSSIGWLDDKVDKLEVTRDDGRFSK
jgi:tRNA (adenine37-N6)-methyltransferase